VREGLRFLMAKGRLDAEANRIPPARSENVRQHALIAA
jgi:hypothetical protein